MMEQKRIELLKLASNNLNNCIDLLYESIIGLDHEQYYRKNLLQPLRKILDNIENRMIKELNSPS